MEPSLWKKINIGKLEIRNRTVMPAMGTGYGSIQGMVTERLKAYLRRRAEGGVGLVITEVCAVHPTAKGFPAELCLYDHSHLPGMMELAAVIKEAGAAAALQLHHAGRETFPQVIGEQPWGPSPIASRAMGQVPREISREEIAQIIEGFACAARRAREAGFDAVEVHGAHGYLVNQFISPYSNQREDEYGGDAEGRFRFALEVVREIKKEAGKDFPVIFRFSSTEAVKGGYDLAYILPLLELLEDEGVDAFHVSCGVYDSPGNPTCPDFHHTAGINVDRAAEVKRHVAVPVIVVGRIHDTRLAEKVVADGKADLIAFGRQHLADPHFLDKAMRGKHAEIRSCLSCNQGCIERLMFEMKSITCTINPDCGRELSQAAKNGAAGGPFMVVGAGPAGLQAALTLGEAGAEAHVIERENEPGGQLRAASRPEGKEGYAGWVNWAVERLEQLGVGIELNREAAREILEGGKWKGVVASTGARPLLPDVKGSELEINAEARKVLMDLQPVGERLVIVGAGPVGMETADYLIERGKKVIVVEELEYPPLPPLTSHGYYLHRKLRENGELRLQTRVSEVTESGVKVISRGEEGEIEADTVVWAVGSVPETEFARAAREAGINTATPGDAAAPRRLIEAVHEGARAARELLYGGEEAYDE